MGLEGPVKLLTTGETVLEGIGRLLAEGATVLEGGW